MLQILWWAQSKRVWLLRQFKVQEHLYMNQVDLLRQEIYQDIFFKVMIIKIGQALPTKWPMWLVRLLMNFNLQQSNLQVELLLQWEEVTALQVLILQKIWVEKLSNLRVVKVSLIFCNELRHCQRNKNLNQEVSRSLETRLSPQNLMVQVSFITILTLKNQSIKV